MFMLPSMLTPPPKRQRLPWSAAALLPLSPARLLADRLTGLEPKIMPDPKCRSRPRARKRQQAAAVQGLRPQASPQMQKLLAQG